MKKIVLILITLILAAGMVFAAEPSTVTITGTIAPDNPGITDDNPVIGDQEGGLWIYSYIQELDSEDSVDNGPGSYNSTNNSELESKTISVNVLHDTKATGAEALFIVYGVACDVPANYAKPPAYTIKIEAPEYFDLVTGTSGDVATTKDDTFALTVVTSLPDETEIDFADSSSDTAKLSLTKTEAGDGIEITTAAGLSNRSATTPELVGWTAVTWNTAAEKIPVAGTYTADIKITIASK